MKAIDTNILVRFLVADDEQQAIAATDCITAGAYVSDGVLMETEWVLRSVFHLARSDIAQRLSDVVELRSLAVDDRALLRWAVTRYGAGADWADLLHLIAARGHEGFITFDGKLERRAGPDAPVRIERLQ